MPLVHDEIATFFNYVQVNEFIPFYATWDANNHILNTLLSIISYRLFGFNELIIRLPNLLIAPLFFYYSYKIAQQTANKKLAWIFLLSLWGSHIFIEFFSLCRGYGMAMAFLFGALWHLFLVLKKDQLKHYLASLIFINLAMLCNLNLIITFLIIIVLLSLNSIIKSPVSLKNLSLRMLVIFFLGIIPAVLFTLLLFIMRDKGLLYYGNPGGFWEVSVLTVLELVSGGTHTVIILITIFYFVLLLVLTGYWFLKHRHLAGLVSPVLIFPYLFFGNLVAIFLIHHILDVNYPQDRTALYLVPYFIGSIFFLADSIRTGWFMKLKTFVVVPFLLLPVHFLSGVNLTHTTIWKAQTISAKYFNTITDDHIHGKYPVTTGAYRMRTLFWYYLNYKYKTCQNPIYDLEYPCLKTDYLIVEPAVLPGVLDKYDSLYHDPVSDHYLMRRKEILGRKLISEYKSISTGEILTKEYFLIARGKLDSLIGKSLYFGLDLTIKSSQKPYRAWIVIEIKTQNHKILSYQYICLPYLKNEWTGSDHNLISGLIVPELPENADHFVCYIWNMKNKDFRLDDGRLSVFVLGE